MAMDTGAVGTANPTCPLCPISGTGTGSERAQPSVGVGGLSRYFRPKALKQARAPLIGAFLFCDHAPLLTTTPLLCLPLAVQQYCPASHAHHWGCHWLSGHSSVFCVSLTYRNVSVVSHTNRVRTWPQELSTRSLQRLSMMPTQLSYFHWLCDLNFFRVPTAQRSYSLLRQYVVSFQMFLAFTQI